MSRLQDWIEEQNHYIGLFATMSRTLEHLKDTERVDFPDLVTGIIQKMQDCLLMIDGQKSHLQFLELVQLTGYTAPLGLQGVMENVAKSLTDYLTDHQELQLASMEVEDNALVFTTTSGRSFVISLQWAKKLAREGITDLARSYTSVIQKHIQSSGDGEVHKFSFNESGYNSFTFQTKAGTGKARRLRVTVVEEV